MAEGFDAVLADLVRLFQTNRRAAGFLGVSHTQLAAWMSGDLPSSRNLERIADVGALVEQFRARVLTDAALLTELHAHWPELGARPSDLVPMGETPRVLEAASTRFASAGPSPSRVERHDLAAALRVLADAATASAEALVHG